MYLLTYCRYRLPSGHPCLATSILQVIMPAGDLLISVPLFVPGSHRPVGRALAGWIHGCLETPCSLLRRTSSFFPSILHLSIPCPSLLPPRRGRGRTKDTSTKATWAGDQCHELHTLPAQARADQPALQKRPYVGWVVDLMVGCRRFNLFTVGQVHTYEPSLLVITSNLLVAPRQGGSPVGLRVRYIHPTCRYYIHCILQRIPPSCMGELRWTAQTNAWMGAMAYLTRSGLPMGALECPGDVVVIVGPAHSFALPAPFQRPIGYGVLSIVRDPCCSAGFSRMCFTFTAIVRLPRQLAKPK